MKVELLHNTPLWVCAKAIRKCWASEGKSDSYVEETWDDINKFPIHTEMVCGEDDKKLIYRVGNKNKHKSTLEHLVYTFDIDGISRACLQEVARHRVASYSVKSTRYTLKELKECDDLYKIDDFLVDTGIDEVDLTNKSALVEVRELLRGGYSNDVVKYSLPEAYKTSLVMTINARSLQNFLELRTSKAALWEIQDLAKAMFEVLPSEHKYLFEDFVTEA